MNIKHLAVVFVLALVLVPGVMQVKAQTDELTNEELHQLILNLTERVDTLEDELDDANTTIDSLEDKIADLENVTSTDDEDGEESSVTERTTGAGVAVCHNGKTQRVNVHSALAYKNQGATLGVCAHERVRAGNQEGALTRTQENDDEDDDEDEVEDEDEDENEDENEEN